MNKIRSKRKIYGIVGSLSILAIPYFIMLLSGHKDIEHAQSYCPFKMLTGFPCPGCGITKSLIFLYEGNWGRSLHYHLFGPFTFLICILAIVVLMVELLTGKDYFQKILYSNKIAIFLGVALAIYHLQRIIVFVSTNNFDYILSQSIWK